MLQRRDAVPVGKGDVGAGLDQGIDGGRVVAAAISEHDGLEQGGAAEIVDVVERRLGRDQGAHDLHVPAVRGVIQGESHPQEFIPTLVDFLMQGKMPVERMMTFYPLAEINRAAQDSSQGTTIKPVLRMPD